MFWPVAYQMNLLPGYVNFDLMNILSHSACITHFHLCRYPLLLLSLTLFLFLFYFPKQNWLEIFQNVSEKHKDFFWDVNAVHFLTSSTIVPFLLKCIIFCLLPLILKWLFFFFLSFSVFLCHHPRLQSFLWDSNPIVVYLPPGHCSCNPWAFSFHVSVFFRGLGSGVWLVGRAFESKLEPLYGKANTRRKRGQAREVFWHMVALLHGTVVFLLLIVSENK